MLLRPRTLLVLALIGCESGGGNSTLQISSAELDKLANVATSDGRRVCLSDGTSPCPLRSAVANWMGEDRYAMWEPGRLVQLYGPTDTTGKSFGALGAASGQYEAVVAVGPDGSDVNIIDGSRGALLRFDKDGKFLGETGVGLPSLTAVPGFAGAIPLYQTLVTAGEGSRLELRALSDAKGVKEAKGDLIFSAPVPWLKVVDERAAGNTPYYRSFPVYAVDADRSVVWSPGDSFRVQRKSRSGKELWTISSDRLGPPISKEEIETRRQESISSGVPEAMADSMAKATGKNHPAVAGIMIAPNGSVLIAGSAGPMVRYYLATKDGKLTGQFSLPASTKPLLYAGDSILVLRPTEGEPMEVRWLKISVPAASK